MLIKKFLKNIIPFLSIFTFVINDANGQLNNKFCYPFYVGITSGYGATTWQNLVPKDPNAAISLSTPTQVSENGFVWGVYGGYEIIPNFAIEANYMRYPKAILYFDELSLFSFYHDITELTTRTESISLLAKLMLFIPHTCGLRAYSSFGAAEVHRYDHVVDRWRLSPSFGAGFNYTITPHVMAELGMEYIAGYGQSELDPADHFIPFLYSGFLRIAYRF